MFKAEERPNFGTVARPLRHALSSETVFRTLAGTDPRPLLVLRECAFCNGTDDALLSKGADNERTFLLSTWFHCVKLPVDVLKPDHPYYELFGRRSGTPLRVHARWLAGLTLESQTSHGIGTRWARCSAWPTRPIRNRW